VKRTYSLWCVVRAAGSSCPWWAACCCSLSASPLSVSPLVCDARDLLLDGINVCCLFLACADLSTGKHSYYRKWKHLEVMLEVAPMITECRRKPIIGNTITTIIFQDGGTFDPSKIVSQVLHVFCVIQPIKDASGKTLYKVSTASKKGVGLPRVPLLLRVRGSCGRSRGRGRSCCRSRSCSRCVDVVRDRLLPLPPCSLLYVSFCVHLAHCCSSSVSLCVLIFCARCLASGRHYPFRPCSSWASHSAIFCSPSVGCSCVPAQS
jgi:Rap/ran-GAP